MGLLHELFSSGAFTPHGYCYLWNTRLVSLHAISDSLITLAYFSIPITLLWFVKKRGDLPFSWMFVLFGVFIVACGSTHAIEVWNIWHGNYWLAGVLKAITAAVSIATAILLVFLVPKAAELPNLGRWAHLTANLQNEIRDRKEMEVNLRISEAAYRDQAELVELTQDAMFVRGPRSEILFWNRAAEQLYGWKKSEILGRTTHELLKTQFPRPLEEIEAEILVTGYWEGELTHHRRDGSAILVSSRWALRKGIAGEPISILETNHDITHRTEEDRKFRTLLDSAPDAMVIVDQGGIIHLVNAQTEKLFSYARSELIGQPVEILLPHRFRKDHVGDREAYSHTPHPRAMGPGLELYGRRKDGTEFPVEISLSPIEAGKGILISSAIRDITTRKRAESKFRDLLEAAPDAIVIVDHSGRIQLVNAQTEKIFGYEREELVGQQVEILVPQSFRENHPAHREGYSQSPHARAMGVGLELFGRRKNGTEFPVEISLSPLETEEGTLISSAIRDVTDRQANQARIHHLNEELNQKVTELSAANKDLESFSYSVSHDLRAPLRHIDGFARILKDEHASELSEEGQKYLDRVMQAANHMGHLVDDLLNLARVGRREMVVQSTKLDDVVRQAIGELSAQDQSRQIEWQLNPLPETDCDPGLIKLVFFNLLANAVKFTRGSQPAVIEVNTVVANAAPVFFVRDNGVGFDPKYADKLFGVFQRLHRQEDFEGTGIGLATVQRIIHRHNGLIWAESKPGVGTTFFFTLGHTSKPAGNNAQEVHIGRH